MRERETAAVGRSSYCFGVLPFAANYISEEVAGFLLYGFLEKNYLCLLSLVFIVVHVILSVKDPNVMLAE